MFKQAIATLRNEAALLEEEAQHPTSSDAESANKKADALRLAADILTCMPVKDTDGDVSVALKVLMGSTTFALQRAEVAAIPLVAVPGDRLTENDVSTLGEAAKTDATSLNLVLLPPGHTELGELIPSTVQAELQLMFNRAVLISLLKLEVATPEAEPEVAEEPATT